jgi:N-acetylglucosamine-6-sulfatase
VIGNASLAWLEEQAAAGGPFFAYIAPHAPHVPATPAHEYENAPLPSETAPRTPNWDYATQHHHWLVSDKKPLTPELVAFSDELYARRLRATMSVDDIVAAVFALLQGRGLLESTYVIYTSDHGYNLGTFRLPSGKFHVFENDIRVPFYVAGPGVTPGAALDTTLVNNVDIGATVLDLAGLGGAGYATDGRSFAAQLSAAGRAAAAWPRDRLLNEYWGMGYTERGPCHNGTSPCPGGVQALEDAPSNSWSALRILNASHNLAYIEYRGASDAPVAPGSTNFTMLFDMQADPWQLVNLAKNDSTAGLVAALHGELWAVATCQGSACP